MKMKCLALLTAFFLIRVHAEGKDDSNSTLSRQGSHYLFKLDNTGANPRGAKRNSRCTPCGNDPGDRREVTNYLDPEYRGNGADNLGYDWSPRAWGGPAFSNRMKNRGRPFANDGWDRERGGRQMPGNWNAAMSPSRFNCDSCRMIWERERGSRARFGDDFNHRMGRWQDDRNGYQGEVATVTSPPIALRPESRIAYVPSPGGEMYWDGVSGGGTRWDGFSNGISWLGGGTRPYDDPRGDVRGYGQGPKRPDDYRDKNDGYFRPWVNEPNRGPPSRYYPAKGYNDRVPTPDQDARYNGYASKWHYGTTNQNGWNGNNMKWSYGSKNWDNRGGGGSYYGGKYDDDGNPLPHGPGAPSPSYGQGHGPQYGSGDYPSSPYGQGGAIQYGQGGSVYYDQGKYIFHYGQGGSPQYPMFKPSNRYPQDGNPPPHPAAGPDYGSRPQKPWDYNINDRYDNREPGYSNINWIRPGPTDPGYSKHPSHGKYPSGGYDDKRKPWTSRPTSGGYGPGSGFPHGGTGYITGSVSHGGDRHPGGDPYGGRPNQGPSYGGNEYPGGQGGYPGSGGSAGYPGGSQGYPGSTVHPGGGGGHRYPGSSGSSLYPGGSGGGSYPGGSGGGSYPGGSGGSYPGGSGGSYPGGSGGGSYPGGSGGSYPGGSGGGSYPGGSGGSYPGGSGGSYPGGSGGSYPGGSGGGPYPGGSGGSYPGGSGGSYPGGSGGGPYPGGSGGGPYPGGGGGGSHPGGSGGGSYPGGSTSHGSAYPGTTGDRGHPGASGGNLYPGGSGNHKYPGPNYISRPGGSGGYPSTHGSSSGYNGPGDSGGGYGPGPGGFGQPGNLDRPGNYYGPRPPPKGYYTGFITELNPNKFPGGVHVGDGNRYPSGGSYPIGDKGSYPDEGQWSGNRYPGGDRFPSEAGGGYHGGHPDRYPSDSEGGHYRPGTQNRFPSDGNAGEDNNAWNYGQEGHKDGIYRRAGGSYPPYRGGPYYTSSYLASASTPSGVSQAPSEGKTQSVTKPDEVTKATPESS